MNICTPYTYYQVRNNNGTFNNNINYSDPFHIYTVQKSINLIMQKGSNNINKLEQGREQLHNLRVFLPKREININGTIAHPHLSIRILLKSLNRAG